jgi:glycosyltransferase involved in cell wall biosynthesis
MRVALIAPPFIPVPPKIYGGTELFLAELAKGLKDLGVEPIVYANGESAVDVEVRSIYQESEWPLTNDIFGSLKDINHTAWAVQDAVSFCDVLHFNNAPGLACSRFIKKPVIHTLHHAKEQSLSHFYSFYPDVEFVTISDFQRSRETMPLVRTIHHGIDPTLYVCKEQKQEYLSFLGRLAPVKGPHLAIEVARRTGIPLKIAGEVQPHFKDYFERMVKPHLDGKFIEYIGEADLAMKNELLGNSMALLFPIQWDEPFGIVLIEAMACGTPVLALPGGSVGEIVREGVAGYICENVEMLAERAKNLNIPASLPRKYVERFFSTEAMARKYKGLYEEVLVRNISPDPELAEPESTAA